MSLYHRLFFPNMVFRQPEEIESLVPFMYLQPHPVVNIEKEILHNEEDEQSESVASSNFATDILQKTNESESFEKLPPQPPFKDIIHPKQSDRLFWCIYIAIYGYRAYTEIGHRYVNTEIEEKQKMIIQMQRSPIEAKQCPKRITKVLYQEIMSDFMINKKVTLDMLIMFAIFYKKRFFIIRQDSNGKNLFYMNVYGGEEPPEEAVVIFHRGRNDYSILLGDEMPDYSNLFCFDHFTSPLKAISNYKTIDLVTIAEKLGLPIGGKKKTELYADILKYTCV